MRPLALFVAFAIIVAACCRQPQIQYPAYDVPAQILELHGDVDFTPRERHLVATALGNLNAQTHGLLLYTIRWDLDFSDNMNLEEHRLDDKLIRVTSDTPFIAEFEEANQVQLMGVTLPSRDDLRMGATIYLISDRLDDARTLVSVVMHESLHLAGVQRHTMDPASLMYYAVHNGYPPVCLHEADVEALCSYYGCLPERIGWCK